MQFFVNAMSCKTLESLHYRVNIIFSYYLQKHMYVIGHYYISD